MQEARIMESTGTATALTLRRNFPLRQQRENKLPVAGVARLRASRFKTEFWRIRLRPQVSYYHANALVQAFRSPGTLASRPQTTYSPKNLIDPAFTGCGSQDSISGADRPSLCEECNKQGLFEGQQSLVNWKGKGRYAGSVE